jgi:phosphoribosyl 1,2-cyclic phosphodiesterase
MSLQIASINSGSNGNCYYIGNHKDAVLIDVGISCCEVERRMNLIGLDIRKVKAVFVSHEHPDHIKGVAGLSDKYQLPVFITEKTAMRKSGISKDLSQSFCADEVIAIGSLTVTAFRKKHDASDPHSFIVSYNDITIGVITDIGTACDNVVKYFSQCHAVFLESNYDDEMLMKGNYSQRLKKRISSDVGHLSNKQALELFINYRPKFMTHVFLSHLSETNNSPETALSLFAPHAGNVKIIVAERHEASRVYIIGQHSQTDSIFKVVQLPLF